MKYYRLLSIPPLLVVLIVMLIACGAFPALAQIANPTPTQPPRDMDGDGVFDINDRCPNEPGPAENNGCPLTPTSVPDTDGDGISDTDDLCPTEPGSRENRGCPDEPTSVPDTDGDGISDTEDLCPTVPGSADNRGCPPDNVDIEPTAVPDSGSSLVVTPTTPVLQKTPISTPASPSLPSEGCYVTPRNDTVNVREKPNTTAPILGHLLFGKVYEAHGYVVIGSDLWFVLTNYEGSANIFGYSSRSVLFASACSEMAYPLANETAGMNWSINQETSDASGAQNPTIEYCVYQEVEEAGVFKQVCYEVEIPEGCVVISSEAGVFTIDCGAGEVSINPLFDELPAEGLQVPTNNPEFVIGLQIYYGTPRTNNGSTVEYCVYQEVEEAGVFKQVCYEVEVPEGCWLVSAEAGVFTLRCRPEIGGEASFTIEQREDSTEASNVIVRHTQPTSPTVLMPTFRDCNDNGIDDLEEFLPPVCSPQLTTNTDGTETNKETEGWWRDVLDLTCPGDWIIVLGTDADGDEVVTDAACVDDIE